MKIDWTDGDTLDYALKLVAWFVWSAEQSLTGPLHSILSRMPLDGPMAIAALALVVIVSIWLLMKLIKLLLMGGFVVTVGLAALYFVR